MSITLEAPAAAANPQQRSKPFTSRSISKASAMGARSGSTANASRTSPRIPPSATRSGCWRASTTLCTMQRKRHLCTPTDTGNGGYTHKFFKASRNAEEMVGARDAIAEWARVTYGWMGRSPDYKAAFLATLGANPDFYKPFDENARRWYKKVQEEVTFVNHAIVNPPVDRNKELVRSARRLHARREGDRRRPDRQRRQGGGDHVHADALQFHRQQRRAADQDQGLRLRLHRAHRRAGREAVLPPFL